jgi:hypothetical protein
VYVWIAFAILLLVVVIIAVVVGVVIVGGNNFADVGYGALLDLMNRVDDIGRFSVNNKA